MSLRNQRKSIPCTIDRRCERPPPPNLAVHSHNGSAPCECIKCIEKQERLLAGAGTGTRRNRNTSNPQLNAMQQGVRNYSEPQLNYALRHQCQMNLVQEKYRETRLQLKNLTPRSKSVIAPKITQKLNFRPGVTVFKNLIPLNVNDSLLLTPHRSAQRGRRKTYDFKVNDFPEPELHHFVEELDKLEYIIPEPDFDLYYTNEKFDYLQTYANLYD